MARLCNLERPDDASFVRLVGANGRLYVFPLAVLGLVYEVAEVGVLKMAGYQLLIMAGAQVAQLEVYKSEGDSLVRLLGCGEVK